MFKYLWIIVLAIFYIPWALISIVDIYISLRDNESFVYESTMWFVVIHTAVPVAISFIMWLYF